MAVTEEYSSKDVTLYSLVEVFCISLECANCVFRNGIYQLHVFTVLHQKHTLGKKSCEITLT
jgi:hypothetical protein